MLIDARLILFPDGVSNAAIPPLSGYGATPIKSDAIDILKMGAESREDLAVIVSVRSAIVTATSLVFEVVLADNFGLTTNPIVISASQTFTPSTSNIAAGTVIRLPIAPAFRYGVTSATTASAKRYLGLRITFAGANAATEYVSAWIGRYWDAQHTFGDLG